MIREALENIHLIIQAYSSTLLPYICVPHQHQSGANEDKLAAGAVPGPRAVSFYCSLIG